MLGAPAAAAALVTLKHGLGGAGSLDHCPDGGLHLPAGGGFMLIGAAVFAIQNDHRPDHRVRVDDRHIAVVQFDPLQRIVAILLAQALQLNLAHEDPHPDSAADRDGHQEHDEERPGGHSQKRADKSQRRIHRVGPHDGRSRRQEYEKQPEPTPKPLHRTLTSRAATKNAQAIPPERRVVR